MALFDVIKELRRKTLVFSVENCDYYKPQSDDENGECYDECSFRMSRRDHDVKACCFDEETIKELRREGVVCPMWNND